MECAADILKCLYAKVALSDSVATLQEIGEQMPSDCDVSQAEDFFLCFGCDIVQADHAPEAGVAQGIFHGILVRHQGKHQEEVEEGLEKEVERRVKREHSSNRTQVRMHG